MSSLTTKQKKAAEEAKKKATISAQLKAAAELKAACEAAIKLKNIPNDTSCDPKKVLIDAKYSSAGGDTGHSFGNLQCRPGEIVTNIKGRADSDHIRELSLTCSDGQILGPLKMTKGGSQFSYTNPEGWKNIKVLSGKYVQNLLGAGAKDNKSLTSKTLQCAGEYTPEDYSRLRVNGISGRKRGGIDKLTLKCGPNKVDWCSDHLEDKMCKGIEIDKKTLNTACSNNFTETCRNRKDDLTLSTITKFCSNNIDDPICSCFKPTPAYIDASLGGIPHCWNQECSAFGYNPNKSTCPNIVICKQDFDSAGDKNLLTGNTIIQECKPSTAITTIVNEAAPVPSPLISPVPSAILQTPPYSQPSQPLNSPSLQLDTSSVTPTSSNLPQDTSNASTTSSNLQQDSPSTTSSDPSKETSYILYVLFLFFIVVLVVAGLKRRSINQLENNAERREIADTYGSETA